jgi:hypothetical protein
MGAEVSRQERPERQEGQARHISSPEVARFGNALNSIGLPVTSGYNPSGLTDNCVFVTLASLLGKTADQLSHEINIEMPANGSGGLSITRLRPVFESIAWVVKTRHVMVAFYSPGQFPNSPQNDDIKRRVKVLELGQRVGVGYRRSDGSGHVVTMQPEERGGYRYLCYQHSPFGRDVTEEVERGTIVFTFSAYPS